MSGGWTIYFDMDGVISDVDGTIAEALGVDVAEIEADRAFRTDCYKRWAELLNYNLEEGFAGLKVHHLEETKGTMRTLVSRGHRVELLTSLGVHRGLFPMDVLTLGTQIHRGKTRWLGRNYSDLFNEGVIHRFNVVVNCDQKAALAGPWAVLVDDQGENVEGFISRGGYGVHYSYRRRDECLQKLWDLL